MTTSALPIAQDRLSRLLAHGNVSPDPNQPRKAFDEASLEEFADTLWREGLINPISVTEEDDASFLIVVGERRWRAFGINQARAAQLLETTPDLPGDHTARAYEAWTVIPAFVEKAIHPVERRLLQLSENDRVPLTLLERAECMAETAKLAKAQLGLNGKDFAKKAGISPQTLSAYMSLLKRTGPTKRATEAGLINDVRALTLFQELNAEEQISLIDRALLEESLISRPMCEALIQARQQAETKKAKASEAPAPPARTAEEDESSSPPTSAAAGTSSAPQVSSEVSIGPTLTVSGLTFVHHLLQEVGEMGDEEPLRRHAIDVFHHAILRESPYIAISDLPLPATDEEGERRSPSDDEQVAA